MTQANMPDNAIHPQTRVEWRDWLEQNHTRQKGIWLVSYKKSTGKPRFEYEEAVEEALCFGWIDSKPNKLDDERSMLWFSPRKGKTGWSKINKDRVERLIAEGRMTPAGLQKIEAARLDGSWFALDTIDALELPADLAKSLQADLVALAYFEAFPRSAKRAILEWISNAKQAQTRSKRINETVQRAAQNIRANQWRQ